MKRFFKTATTTPTFTVRSSRSYNTEVQKTNSFSAPPTPFVCNKPTELIKIANPEIFKINLDL